MGAGCSINIDNSKVIHQPSSNSNEQKEYCQTNKDCIDMGHICKGEDDDEVCLTDYDSAGRQLENPMCVCRNPEMDYGTSIQITKMLKITELGFQIPIDSSFALTSRQLTFFSPISFAASSAVASTLTLKTGVDMKSLIISIVLFPFKFSCI